MFIQLAYDACTILVMRNALNWRSSLIKRYAKIINNYINNNNLILTGTYYEFYVKGFRSLNIHGLQRPLYYRTIVFCKKVES